MTRAIRFTLLLLAGLPVGTSCNLLVEVNPPRRVEGIRSEVEPLTSSELLDFTWQNLGEVEPGLLYRSKKPSLRLLSFLRERVRLGAVIDLTLEPDPVEVAYLEELGVEHHPLPLNLEDPPPPGHLLELMRLTHRARREGFSLLIHCRVGADRAGAMVGMWRRLFQEVEDLDALRSELWLHRHVHLTVPMTYDAIERLRPELLRPAVENPELLDDPAFLDELDRRYYRDQPLLSGRRGVTRGPLRAGAARVDLVDGLIFPVPMATYGPLPAPAVGVRRSVHARALLLDNGSTRLALVSCDLMLIDKPLRDRVMRELAERRIEVGDLLLAATHTHTSLGGYVDHPASEFYILGEFDPEVRDHLVGRICDAIQLATQALVPARLGTGSTKVEGISFNRRLGDTVDPRVGILRVTDDEGAPLATVVQFAGHPILDPGKNRLSPDYPGLLAGKLDEMGGVGLFFNGALGDLNACAPDREGGWRTEGLAQAVAGVLEERVREALPGISTEREVALASMTAWMALPPLNPGIIPDFLFPLDFLLGWIADWPERTPLQALRIGESTWVATSTELGVRPGLLIQRESPGAEVFVVSHANGYAGYAVLPQTFALSKVDPTSVVLVNGSTEGHRLVEESVALARTVWGGESPEEPRDDGWIEAIIEEDPEFHRDPTRIASRRLRALGSGGLQDLIQLEITQLYLEDYRGGDDLKGRLRESRIGLRARLPGDVTVGLETGYWRSDWREGSGARRDHEGALDLTLDVAMEFELLRHEPDGIALRLTPSLAVIVPTGDSLSRAPLSLAPAAGVWRAAPGLALEFTWNGYRAFTLETRVDVPRGRHDDRRPGLLWESALRYSERHGWVTWYLDWVARVKSRDSRRGGLTENDAPGAGHSLGFRPGLSLHLGEHVQAYFQVFLPLARHGVGVSEGRGGQAGLSISF